MGGELVRLLDLYCGAGGAAAGYAAAGFDVTGVDIRPQRNYPFEFVQGDAIEYLAAHGDEFDAVHASPPCQAYSVSTHAMRNAGVDYPDLLAATRAGLERAGRPWVIENVPGAPMRPDLRLCGCFFGLRVRRERWFETSWEEFAMTPTHDHSRPALTVTGNGTPSWTIRRLGYAPSNLEYRDAMGIDWMTRRELSQAIPPAYTRYVGQFLAGEVMGAAA